MPLYKGGVLARHLAALLDEFSQCLCTKAEYTNWDPAVVLMTFRKVAASVFSCGTIPNQHGT